MIISNSSGLSMRHLRQTGVTLIELMIVVGIVAILAAIAYPSYQDSVRKSRRSDGIGALLKLQMAQEKLRSSCRFYAAGLDTAGNTCGVDAANSKVLRGATSPDGHYTLAITSASSTGFTATATGLNDQANDAAGGATCTLVLTVNAANPNGARSPADCWD